jgi:hypothetical protein
MSFQKISVNKLMEKCTECAGKPNLVISTKLNHISKKKVEKIKTEFCKDCLLVKRWKKIENN